MPKKIYQQTGTNLEIITPCRICNEDCSVDMTYDQYKRLTMYQSGTGHAQTMLSDIPRNVREIFISGICPECWDRMFGKSESNLIILRGVGEHHGRQKQPSVE